MWPWCKCCDGDGAGDGRRGVWRLNISTFDGDGGGGDVCVCERVSRWYSGGVLVKGQRVNVTVGWAASAECWVARSSCHHKCGWKAAAGRIREKNILQFYMPYCINGLYISLNFYLDHRLQLLSSDLCLCSYNSWQRAASASSIASPRL